MNREKIDIEDLGFIVKRNLVEKHNDFNFIEEVSVYQDLEKSYEDLEVVIQRKSDLKYFKFSYWRTAHCEQNFENTTATEVFKKQKVVDYYE